VSRNEFLRDFNKLTKNKYIMKNFVVRWLKHNNFKPVDRDADFHDSGDFESPWYEDVRIEYASAEDSDTPEGIVSIYHRIFKDEETDTELDFDLKFELIDSLDIVNRKSRGGLEEFLYTCEKIKDFLLT
jgi:hypothetical protein